MKTALAIIGGFIIIVFLFVFLFVVGHGTKIADKIADDALINYEEFQEIYNTCKKIDSDLGNIRAVPDNDKMFESISKQAMITAKRQQMNRWVEEYNAKSKMWNRSLWKSSKLPYQLSSEEFKNY